MNIFAVIQTDYSSGSEQLILNSTDFKYVVNSLPDYYEKGTNLYVQVWKDNNIQKIFMYVNNTLELIVDFEEGGE